MPTMKVLNAINDLIVKITLQYYIYSTFCNTVGPIHYSTVFGHTLGLLTQLHVGVT